MMTRRPRPPRSCDVSAVLAYVRAMERYVTALEAALREARKAKTP